jgi:hypothetical protein
LVYWNIFLVYQFNNIGIIIEIDDLHYTAISVNSSMP